MEHTTALRKMLLIETFTGEGSLYFAKEMYMMTLLGGQVYEYLLAHNPQDEGFLNGLEQLVGIDSTNGSLLKYLF